MRPQVPAAKDQGTDPGPHHYKVAHQVQETSFGAGAKEPLVPPHVKPRVSGSSFMPLPHGEVGGNKFPGRKRKVKRSTSNRKNEKVGCKRNQNETSEQAGDSESA